MQWLIWRCHLCNAVKSKELACWISVSPGVLNMCAASISLSNFYFWNMPCESEQVSHCVSHVRIFWLSCYLFVHLQAFVFSFFLSRFSFVHDSWFYICLFVCLLFIVFVSLTYESKQDSHSHMILSRFYFIYCLHFFPLFIFFFAIFVSQYESEQNLHWNF